MAASSSCQGASPALAASGILPAAAASEGGQSGACPLPGRASKPAPALRIAGREPLPGVFPVAPGDAVRVAGFGLARIKGLLWDALRRRWAASCILAGTVPLGRIEAVRR